MLFFVLALLISFVLSYFILVMKVSSQEQTLLTLEERIEEMGTERQRELEDRVFDYQERINIFSFLLENHKIPSNMLNLLEGYTLPNVWFEGFNLDSEESTVELKGFSENMKTLAQQMDILEKDGYIEEIELLSAKISEEGGIEFTLGLSFNPQLLIY